MELHARFFNTPHDTGVGLKERCIIIFQNMLCLCQKDIRFPAKGRAIPEGTVFHAQRTLPLPAIQDRILKPYLQEGNLARLVQQFSKPVRRPSFAIQIIVGSVNFVGEPKQRMKGVLLGGTVTFCDKFYLCQGLNKMTAFRQKIIQQFHIPIIAGSTIIFSLMLLRWNKDAL